MTSSERQRDRVVDFLSEQLGRFQKCRFTGRLDVQVGEQHWYLYLALGRFAWAAGGNHATRRWRRQMIRSGLFAQASKIRPRQADRFECWGYQVLTILAQRHVAGSEQAIAVIRGIVVEVLFDIIQAAELANLGEGSGASSDRIDFPESPVDSDPTGIELDIVPRVGVRPSNTDTAILPRTWTVESELTLKMTQAAWQQWVKAGLAVCSPNLAPVLSHPQRLHQQTSAKTYQMLAQLINGRRSLRDITVLVKKDLLGLTRSLLPHVRQQAIGLVEIGDLPLPHFARATESDAPDEDLPTTTPARAAEQSDRPGTIVCIDDSLQICQQMASLLKQANHKVVAVQDAIQALPTLLQHKPDLIFLDLVMPIASGYEICTQIRRVDLLKDTPVIILTGNDGIIDRVRAKMVGATDFLAKPISSEKVLTAVQKHIGSPATTADR